MAGKIQPSTIAAMELVIANTVPYTAAKQCKIDVTTLYRSRLYKMHKAGQHQELRAELDRLKSDA